MTIKFKKLEQFIEQKAAMEQVFNEMTDREEKAKEAYDTIVAEYEGTISRAAIEGKDLTAELDKLDEEISKAKAALERRAKERQIYSATRPLEKIKSEDVVESFNKEVIPAFRAKRFDDVLKRVLKAKSEYAEAVLDYKAAVREFEELRSEARSELSDHYYYKLSNVDLRTRPEVEKYFITQNDLFDLRGGNPLRSLQYVKTEELTND
ncbi:hypothetical protein BAOM_4596 [Peribacillus asahii]|uniref:Uncharacterized protein n=1 Tax=Peribacillus asahii TaxID=228899 RepID=A0A3Q9RRM1_9BACI|nr:hypothetical protein [Peribacillus asahii]AZV45175.1 hypothetical protein BAOM_4596 [Peribacillus asahii]